MFAAEKINILPIGIGIWIQISIVGVCAVEFLNSRDWGHIHWNLHSQPNSANNAQNTINNCKQMNIVSILRNDFNLRSSAEIISAIKKETNTHTRRIIKS